MRASVGCVMRNRRGEWIKGAGGMIGLCVPLGAELWSIFYGLKLAWEKEVKHVVIESDCEEAVNQVNSPDPDFGLIDLIMLIKNIEGEAWESCVIQHCSSGANAAAVALANHELNGDGGIEELDDAPGFMHAVLEADRA